jgi:pyruvate dehydrogenase E1 component beta subunit
MTTTEPTGGLSAPAELPAPAGPERPAPAAERTLSFAQALNDALDVALGLDPRVFLLGEDIADPGGGVYRVTKGLSTKYGDGRVRKTPISEGAILGAAVGAAIAGKLPVAEIMIMDFLAVCLDQLSNHAAKIRYMSGGQTSVPLVVRTSAGAGMQFGAQHSSLLEAWAVHMPGVKVVVPSTPADAKGLLLSAVFDPAPVLFVEMMMLYSNPKVAGPVPEGDVRVPLGSAVVRRKGKDVSVLTYGRQVHDALAVAKRLSGEGIDVEVVDLRSLVPLDEATVFASVGKTKNAVVVHEAVTRGGFGAELSSRVHEELFADLERPVARVGAANTPVPFARELEQAYLPNQARIADAIRTLLT